MSKGEESGIANCAMIEASGEFGPELTCKWTLDCSSLDEIFLIWGKQMLAGLEGGLREGLILKSVGEAAWEVVALCES
jgi:hypothetical protein